MLKNIVGALALTVFVFVAVNLVGDLAFPPQSSSPSVAEKAPEPVPAPEPQAEPEETVQAEPAPEPAPEPAREPAREPVVATDPEPAPKAMVEAAPEPVAEVVAAVTGDVDKGKKTFRRKCKTCHTSDKGARNMTGPNLFNIVGRDKGKVEGFRYSKTLSLMGGTWTEADILSFIASPRTYVTDTKMAFAGLKKEKDRQDVLAYLKSLKDE
ncbi:cytochrome c family protein [Magnetovibrio sp. PR-2]|uniref:c-type cytochrome n=1 Tax=Magnetovibrio sp. PR-2 TaxID=3120356 RepID=UPI002FCDE379